MAKDDIGKIIFPIALLGVGAYFLFKYPPAPAPPEPPPEEPPPEEPPPEEPPPEEPPPEDVIFELTKFNLFPYVIRQGGSFEWQTEIANYGIPHEINCGMSIFELDKETLVADAPWFKIKYMNTGDIKAAKIPLKIHDDFPRGTYNVVCKLWERSVGGIIDRDFPEWTIYQAGSGDLYGTLDEVWTTIQVI